LQRRFYSISGPIMAHLKPLCNVLQTWTTSQESVCFGTTCSYL